MTRLVRDLSTASCAALAFLVWDILITLDDEVEHIWSKPSTSWIKWAFLFARYISLLTQTLNRALEWAVLNHTTFHGESLRIWFGTQVILAFLIMFDAEIVMMARVYALYNKNRRVGYGFLTLLTIEAATVITGIVMSFPSADDFSPGDIIKHTSGGFKYFGIVSCLSQIIVLVLSVVRYMRRDWGRARIVHLMLRDGTIAFSILFIVTSILVVYVILDLPYAATDYAWMISFISSTECRLILNMLRLPIDDNQYTTTTTAGPELTTVLYTTQDSHPHSHDATRDIEMTVYSSEVPQA